MLISKVLKILALMEASAMAWHFDGTVVSDQGGPISSATVSVMDSASLGQVTTNAQGWFEIEHQSATSIRQTSNPGSISYHISGKNLTIQNIQDGIITLSLVDPLGKTLWNRIVLAQNGTAYLQLPQESFKQSTYLTIQTSEGVVQKAPLVSKRMVAQTLPYPILQFQKEGFQDTTYQMESDSIVNGTIVMRDTTTPILTCPSQVLTPGDHQKTVQVGGASRTYILHVPSSYKGTEAVPLVVDFHPLGGSGSGELNSSPYKAATDPEGVITAYPDGNKGPSGGAWDVGPCCVDSPNDTAFARALVSDVMQSACINPKRIYAVGFSMGGGMSHYVACHMADLFAAAAPAAFDLLEENQSSCHPSRPMPIIIFRSTGDFVVSYNGGASSAVQGMPINFLGAQGSFKKWAEINQCSQSPTAENSDGCSTYETCSDAVKVTLCTKQGGGHDYGNASVGWPWLKQFEKP